MWSPTAAGCGTGGADMSRKETLLNLDELLKVCSGCDKKKTAGYLSTQHNRFQHYCHNKCKTGKKLQRIADDLDAEVRARRKQKKGVSA
jgi:hypothetical protein